MNLLIKWKKRKIDTVDLQLSKPFVGTHLYPASSFSSNDHSLLQAILSLILPFD